MTPGTVLGQRYVLGTILGSGGMAEVYRAQDQVLGREVAVKVIRTSTAQSERSRFAGEARVLASLNHPGLVTILDANVDGESPYLVMELIDGPTLARTIQDRGPLNLGEIARIGAQLATALSYAHGQGVVHRDVKPSNILMCATDRVVLSDFGIARLLGDADHHTRTGETIGSPAYLAPEQVAGESVTSAVDVYSLGLVLIEACTGARAYLGTPVEAAVMRLTTAPAIPVSLSRPWQDLLARMTHRTPSERPTAAEVATLVTTLTGASSSADAAPRTPLTPTLGAPDQPTAPLLVEAPLRSDLAPQRPRFTRTRVLLAAGLLAVVGLAVGGLAHLTPDDAAAGPTSQAPSPSPSAVPVLPTTGPATEPASPSPTAKPAATKPKPAGPSKKVNKAKGKKKRSKKK